MSPIDDELRTALSSRADSLSVSPDFVAGVERRATRMRRQRVAGAVAGSAVVVSVLGLGGPMLAASLTSTAPSPLDAATTAPAPPTADRFALDPADPWPYRGLALDQLGEDFVETAEREWQVRHPGSDLRPLFGQVHEPSQAAELVFVAVAAEDGPDSRVRWGVVRSSEAGPEFVHDDSFTPGQRFGLAAALPGDEVARLLVVAAPGTTVEHAQPEQPLEPVVAVADGVGVAPLEGDVDGDHYGVRAPDGSLLTQLGAPDPTDDEDGTGARTDAAPDVEPAPYALDVDDPWAYRGPAELSLHPDLGTQDERLFEQGGSGRDDGSWSQRPLLAVEEEATGLSALMVLHRSGDEAFVTTTWQTQDEAPRQSEQPVRDGQLLVQSVLPDAGPAGVLIALASPKAGAVETDVARTRPTGVTPGVLVAELPADPPAGSLFLYSEDDGLLYHSEPARRS